MMTDLLLFRVGRELFAAELSGVEEAVDLASVGPLQRLPGTAPTARGLLTVRGVLVPLFSPAGPLGVAPEGASTALVIRENAGRVAIIVDDVEDVLTLREGELRPAPAGDARDGGVLRGVARRGALLVAVVDLGALVAACRTSVRPEAA
jgi:chemotaxis signal transduction protein